VDTPIEPVEPRMETLRLRVKTEIP